MSSSASGRRAHRARAVCARLGITGAAGLALLILFAVLPAAARADGGGWGTAGAFANLEPGGRGAGLAGALAPLVDDATAVHWNPSRLVALDRRALAVTYADLFGLGLARHTAVFLAFPRRARALDWEDGRLRANEGAPGSAWGLGVQATGVDLDPESYAEYDVALAYARRGALGLAWGAAAHGLFVRGDLSEASASGFSADLSLNRAWGAHVDACLVLRSLLSRLDWKGADGEALRPSAQLGLVARPVIALAIPVVATYDFDAGALTEAAAGAEWQAFGETLVLRAGLRWRDDGDEAEVRPAAGAGLRWKDLAFDYGLAMGPEALGDTHRLSLHVRF